MHDSYNQIMFDDLQEFDESLTRMLFASGEAKILSSIDYTLVMRGGVPLRSLNYALLHYSKKNDLSKSETVQICSIGEDVLEQTLIKKSILSRRNRELIASIVIVTIGLFNQNNLKITCRDLEWGMYILQNGIKKRISKMLSVTL